MLKVLNVDGREVAADEYVWRISKVCHGAIEIH